MCDMGRSEFRKPICQCDDDWKWLDRRCGETIVMYGDELGLLFGTLVGEFSLRRLRLLVLRRCILVLPR